MDRVKRNRKRGGTEDKITNVECEPVWEYRSRVLEETTASFKSAAVALLETEVLKVREDCK
jgi:hypothetical protein